MLKECLARFIISFPVGYIMVHILRFYRGLSSTINYTYISILSMELFFRIYRKNVYEALHSFAFEAVPFFCMLSFSSVNQHFTRIPFICEFQRVKKDIDILIRIWFY